MLKAVKYLIGSVGPSGYGSKSTADEVAESCPDLRSSTVIITGATSGIGAETARVLAKQGARLILPVRNLKAGEETKARIVSETPDSEIVIMALDLSSLSSVRKFVSDFESLNLPLNILINNAGIFPHKHEITEDGIEKSFATNYLGHFLLTNLLLKKLIESATESGIQGRIVNVSSGIHGWFSGDLITYLDQTSKNKIPYDPTQAYALSKLANVLHAKQLANRLQEMNANVTANCVDPGIAKTRLNREREGLITDLVFFVASMFLKTISQAAATTCYVAIHPKMLNKSGQYYSDCNEASPSKLGSNSIQATKLWDASQIMLSANLDKTFDYNNT